MKNYNFVETEREGVRVSHFLYHMPQGQACCNSPRFALIRQCTIGTLPPSLSMR
jgi:hypothetical protein